MGRVSAIFAQKILKQAILMFLSFNNFLAVEKIYTSSPQSDSSEKQKT